MKALLRGALPLVLLVLTVLGLVNTYGDAADVERLAGAAACGDEAGCALQMREFTRNALGHEYVFAVGKSGALVHVKCARGAVFFGDYACQKQP